MSMFENKTKPELERGNFIAYADEPDTVIDSPGGGGGGDGGGVAVFHGTPEMIGGVPVIVVDFTYNDIIAEAESKPVFLIVSGQGNSVCYLLVSATSTGGTYAAAFEGTGSQVVYTASNPDDVMEATS